MLCLKGAQEAFLELIQSSVTFRVKRLHTLGPFSSPRIHFRLHSATFECFSLNDTSIALPCFCSYGFMVFAPCPSDILSFSSVGFFQNFPSMSDIMVHICSIVENQSYHVFSVSGSSRKRRPPRRKRHASGYLHI